MEFRRVLFRSRRRLRRTASRAGVSRSRCSSTTGCHHGSQTTPDHTAQGPLRGRRGIRSCRRRQRRQFHRTRPRQPDVDPGCTRSEEHTSELQSLMRILYAGFCLKKKKRTKRKKKKIKYNKYYINYTSKTNTDNSSNTHLK